MTLVAVALSGQLGSGKTTLTKRLNQVFGGVLASFGDYVRAEASRLGRGDSRQTLQFLGESLIADRGWDQFCQDALIHFGWSAGSSVVIDGVRHVEVVNSLRRLVAPTQLILVYLQVDEDVRQERLLTRGMAFVSQLKTIESHSSESQVPFSLPEVADLILEGSDLVDANVMRIAVRAGLKF